MLNVETLKVGKLESWKVGKLKVESPPKSNMLEIPPLLHLAKH